MTLLIPEGWQRLSDFEHSANPFVPDPAFVGSSPDEDVQLTIYYMSLAVFAENSQTSPTTPRDAGAAIWDKMFTYFLYFDLQDRLQAELSADITVAGLPAAMVLFTSPGMGTNLGVENPMELVPEQDTYYKELIVILPDENVCYIVITAKTNTARAGNELAQVIDSIAINP